MGQEMGEVNILQIEYKQTLGFDERSIEQVNQAFHNLVAYLLSLDPDVTLEIANSIWHERSRRFHEEFISHNRDFFDAEVTGLDFGDPGTVDRINGWVNDKTHGKIKDIVTPPIDRDMVMFLLNAIYFKGSWTNEFDPEHTSDDFFHPRNGESQAVKMMYRKQEFHYYEDSAVQVVELPYGGKRFAMTVILPRPDLDIDQLVRQLETTQLNRWLGYLPERDGRLYLPRFKLEYEETLNDILISLGMTKAFLPFQADFSGMSDDTLFIDEVKHKSYVEVNEEGTEAAAVTSVGMALASAVMEELPPFEMRVDRPFVFVIHEKVSHSTLFVGKVMSLGE